MGSGSEPHRELALPLGAWLARRGVHLLTGGGGGVMASVSEGFARVGSTEGSGSRRPPARTGESALPAPGYPNPWVEIAIRTHLPQRGEAGAGHPLAQPHQCAYGGHRHRPPGRVRHGERGAPLGALRPAGRSVRPGPRPPRGGRRRDTRSAGPPGRGRVRGPGPGPASATRGARCGAGVTAAPPQALPPRVRPPQSGRLKT